MSAAQGIHQVLTEEAIAYLRSFLADCCVRADGQNADLQYVTYDGSYVTSLRKSFKRWLQERGLPVLYELPGRNAHVAICQEFIQEVLGSPVRAQMKHRYHKKVNACFQGWRLREHSATMYYRELTKEEKTGANTPPPEQTIPNPTTSLLVANVPHGLQPSTAASVISQRQAAKRLCLGNLEQAFQKPHVPLAPDLLAAISDDDGPRDKKRSKINYLKETVMLNWHSDLCAVTWLPKMPSTFAMGLCAENEESAGWALGVECSLVGGPGENMILFEGPLSADDQLKESAWVAMALVKTRLRLLRRMFTGQEDSGGDLFDRKSDIKLFINPTNFMKQGSSLGAAMFVSMVALGTGCSTKSRVAISGCVDLNGQLDSVAYEEAKARGAQKGKSTMLLLPPRPVKAPSEKTDTGGAEMEIEDVSGAEAATGPRTAGGHKEGGTEAPHLLGGRGGPEVLEGVEVLRVRDVWDLALAAIQPMPGVTLPAELTEQQRGQLDPDCFYGCASAATYFLYKDAEALSATIQEIECIIFPGSGGTFASGAVGPMTDASCHAAVSWLSQYGAAELGDFVQLANPRDYVYHFHYPPYDLPNDELHLGPTAYMALISAVTGWKANKKVSILGEVGMGGYFLEMLEPLSEFDIRLIGALPVDTLIVPTHMLAETRQTWQGVHGRCGPQEVVGCDSILDCAMYVFPEYRALVEGAQATSG